MVSPGLGMANPISHSSTSGISDAPPRAGAALAAGLPRCRTGRGLDYRTLSAWSVTLTSPGRTNCRAEAWRNSTLTPLHPPVTDDHPPRLLDGVDRGVVPEDQEEHIGHGIIPDPHLILPSNTSPPCVSSGRDLWGSSAAGVEGPPGDTLTALPLSIHVSAMADGMNDVKRFSTFPGRGRLLLRQEPLAH